MRPVHFFIVLFGASLTAVYVDSKPVHSSGKFLLPNDIMRVKKRHEDSSTGYLEQCGIVAFPKAQQGVVNVLAFLDSSWPYSHRQAIMLKMLNERLRRSGLPDTQFFVVNVDPSSAPTVDSAEDDIEREAWLGVSPDEIDTFSDIVKTTDSLAMSMTPDIQLIQDNKDLEIWKGLRGSRDQVLVIDRCGKLTYQVIVPWSILHFPYVKAAILSTYKDEPCGPCDLINNTRDATKRDDEATPQRATLDSEIGSDLTTEEYFQNDREGHAPVTSDSDLRSTLHSFTAGAGQSGSSPNYVTSKVPDDSEEAATTRNTIDDPDNRTTTDSSAEFDITTLGTVINTEASHFTNAVTSPPISGCKITRCNTTDESLESKTASVFEFNETTTVPQNTESSLPDIEANAATISTNFMNSDATDPTYDALYYDTTATVITSGSDTTQESSESYPTRSFDVLPTSTSSDVQLDNIEITDKPDDLATSENIIVDTTTEETVNSNTVFRIKELNEDESSEGLKDGANENSEVINSPLLSDVPLRIIMHAPHFHVDGDSTRMHEYLVLKTGSFDYHRHLASCDATRLYRGPQDFQEATEYLRNHEIESRKWPMTNVIYNKDESPGLYGEVADYWKNSGSQENYEYAEETETPVAEHNTEEPNADDRICVESSKPNSTNVTDSGEAVKSEPTLSGDGSDNTMRIAGKLQVDLSDESDTEKEALNAEEEETRSKLIAHYSKLLPWIYYVLDK